MARTTHHVSYRQRLSNRTAEDGSLWSRSAPPPPRPVRADDPAGIENATVWNTTTTLRYPASELDRADRRPRPVLIRRSYVSYSYVRTWDAPSIDDWCALLERGTRSRLRDQTRRAVQAANAQLRSGSATADGWGDDVADFDVVPVRHRGSARWKAW